MKNLRKWIVRLMPVIALIIVAGLILSRVYRPESTPAEPDLRITVHEAAEHIGERAVVCGIVESADFVPSVGGEPTFLNFGRPHPDQVFTVVIWGEDRARWPAPPEERYLTQRICVTGTIQSHQGVPQIRARVPQQIKAQQI